MAERQQRVDQLAQLAGGPLPDRLMMDDDQVRQLHRAGMGIGGHTLNHPILARLPAEEARAEIAAGKASLEHMIGAPVTLFAYPNGKPGTDYQAEHVEIVRELGFEAAVSTAWGASRTPDFFQLPRFTPWDRQRRKFLLRLMRNLTTTADIVGAGQ
jgi:peptidoglycan/xylan/chitin deacetylase (PgdA/CDA1 family)